VTYTVSIGIAEFNGADDSLFALMKRADAALYQAKQSGRNRSQVFKNE
jgi:diguanylate cyclase (GGDEF)-like protein